VTAADYGDLRRIVITHIRLIEAGNPEPQSIEWFLLRYLRRIVAGCEASASPHALENSMRALLSFYAGRIEQRSELAEYCIRIIEAHRSAAPFR
jgi:hypothetical protein